MAMTLPATAATNIAQDFRFTSEPCGRVRSSQRIGVVILVTLIGLVYFLTIKDGQPWGDDFAMYIMQARQIAKGSSPSNTGYVYNPYVPNIGPTAYPPLYPILLSPLCFVWDVALRPMKIEEVIFLCIALFILYELARLTLTHTFAASIVLLIAACPFFWQFKDYILSEYSFLMLTLATLLLISFNERTGWKRLNLAVMAGIGVYLCFATRTVGVALLPCFFATLLSRRAPHRNSLIGFLVAVTLVAVSVVASTGHRSYVDQFHVYDPLGTVRINLIAHFWHLRHTIFGFTTLAAGAILAGLFFLLVVGGMARQFAIGARGLDVFIVTYSLIIVLWPGDNEARLWIPVLPLMSIYAVEPIAYLPRRAAAVASLMLLALLGMGFTEGYSHLSLRPIEEGIADPQFRQMCAYIENGTPNDAVVIFSKPRVLALLSGRHSSTYSSAEPADNLFKYFSSISARFILVNSDFVDDRKYLQPILEAQNMPEKHRVGRYHLYQLR